MLLVYSSRRITHHGSCFTHYLSFCLHTLGTLGGSVSGAHFHMPFYFCIQPGYWGLSDSSFGCSACECDIGGSYQRNCEQITGQCRCRKGITGRKCDQVQTGNFFPLPDHLKYESEEAKVVGVCRPLNNYNSKS